MGKPKKKNWEKQSLGGQEAVGHMGRQETKMWKCEWQDEKGGGEDMCGCLSLEGERELSWDVICKLEKDFNLLFVF